MKKSYSAPQAELICFAPVEHIASWYLDNGDNKKTWTFFNHWGSLGEKHNTSGQVSGIMNWYDEYNTTTGIGKNNEID